jgi:hypothetical protein
MLSFLFNASTVLFENGSAKVSLSDDILDKAGDVL